MAEFPSEFWDNLDQAQANGTFQYRTSADDIPDIQTQKMYVLQKIEEIIVGLLRDMEMLKPPTIQFRGGSSNNFGLMLKVLSTVYRLIASNQTATKRDLYYGDPQLFKSQITVNHIIDDIACMIDIPRYMLNVVATSKGLVSGDLQYACSDRDVVDCSDSSSGVSVPIHVHTIDTVISRTARFILVVEKDASFQRLLEDGLPFRLSCIMITGKGVPDVNTRMFTKLLSDELRIPVFGLFDADPHGIEIMCVYRFGSLSLAYDSINLAVSNLRWIGLQPTDIVRLGLLKHTLLPFSDRDARKCRDIIKRPYMKAHPDILNQVKVIQHLRCKAELQALEHISQSYLTDRYIPSKISSGEWL